MSQVSCPHCGFRNFTISAYCGRCERPLGAQADSQEHPQPLIPRADQTPSRPNASAARETGPPTAATAAATPQPARPTQTTAPNPPAAANPQGNKQSKAPKAIRTGSPKAAPTGNALATRGTTSPQGGHKKAPAKPEVRPEQAHPAASARPSRPPATPEAPAAAARPPAPSLGRGAAPPSVAATAAAATAAASPAPNRAQRHLRPKLRKQAAPLPQIRVRVAPPWRQWLARLTDGGLILAIGSLLSAAEVALFGPDWLPQPQQSWLQTLAEWVAAHAGAVWHGAAAAGCFAFAYMTLTGLTVSRTLGQRLTGTVVVRDSGVRLSSLVVVARTCIAFVSLAACGAGFFWVILDRYHRTWHDLFAGTVLVVRRVALPAPVDDNFDDS